MDGVYIHLFLDRAVAQGIVIVKKTDKRLDQYLLRIAVTNASPCVCVPRPVSENPRFKAAIMDILCCGPKSLGINGWSVVHPESWKKAKVKYHCSGARCKDGKT